MAKTNLGKIKNFFKTYILHILFFIGVLILYSFSLDKTPVHLNQDELMFALNSKSIATSLKDYYGNFLPFYFWHLGSFWATPVVTYLGALVLRFAPFSEAGIRLTSVFVGMINVALMMILVNKVFRSKKLSLLAGFLIATTPVHFIHSRLLLDNLYTVPFVLIWLIFIKEYLDRKSPWLLFVAGLSLGVGLHSYHAAKVVMPLFFLASLALVLIRERFNLKSLSALLLGFFVPIIIFIPWLVKHPDTLLNQVNYVGSIDTSINTSKGIWGVLSTTRLTKMASSYFSYFSPEILFTSGDRSLIHSTGKVGAFLFPVSFLVAFGLLNILFKKKDPFSLIVVFGLLVYPVAPALVMDPQRISRGLIAIPFIVLVATYGMKYFMEAKNKELKLFLKAIVLLLFLQFFVFLTDYFGTYRIRSRAWFNNDIGGAFESVLKSNEIRKIEKIYIDKNIYFASYYFDFYQTKKGIDVSQKSTLFNPILEDFSAFDEGSIVTISAESLGREKPDTVGGFEKVEVIRELDGVETFYVYYRPLGLE